MKLDVQGSTRPILRLHDFDQPELVLLRQNICRLANRDCAILPLHQQPFVKPVGGCQLTLKASSRDHGIEHSIEPNLFGWTSQPGTWDPFVCELTPVTWGHVTNGIDLLLQLRFLCSEYVWLHKQWNSHGTAAWLLSPTGEW
ncbi:MAG: hypothetical protein ACO34E_04580 [Limisphaerales bacterium]|jgi:hypothetical protein